MKFDFTSPRLSSYTTSTGQITISNGRFSKVLVLSIVQKITFVQAIGFEVINTLVHYLRPVTRV